MFSIYNSAGDRVKYSSSSGGLYQLQTISSKYKFVLNCSELAYISHNLNDTNCCAHPFAFIRLTTELKLSIKITFADLTFYTRYSSILV